MRIVNGFVFRCLLFYSVKQCRLVVRCRRFGITYRPHIRGSSSSLVLGTLRRSAALNTVMRGWEFVDWLRDGLRVCQLLKVCFVIRVLDNNGF